MFTKSTSNETIDNAPRVGVESYFHKFQFSYCFQSFHVKCRPTVTLQSIGGFGLNFLNLTPLIQNPGSVTGPGAYKDGTKLSKCSKSLFLEMGNVHSVFCYVIFDDALGNGQCAKF